MAAGWWLLGRCGARNAQQIRVFARAVASPRQATSVAGRFMASAGPSNPYATALDGLILPDPVRAFFDFCRCEPQNAPRPLVMGRTARGVVLVKRWRQLGLLSMSVPPVGAKGARSDSGAPHQR